MANSQLGTIRKMWNSRIRETIWWIIYWFRIIYIISEAITEGDDIMAAVDERDKILKKYMNEWDELNLDLIITPASLMPAPLKVKIILDQIIFSKIKYSMILLHILSYSWDPINQFRNYEFWIFFHEILFFSNLVNGIFLQDKSFRLRIG